jgi:O-antigen/teichoic acid export membrane protein
MALMTVAGAVLVIPLVVFGHFLLVFIFGLELEAAYGLVVVLALAAAVRLLSFPLEPALISTDRAGMALVVRSVAVSVFLVTLFALIPSIGLIGSGVAGIAAALVSFAGQSMAVMAWFRSRLEEPASTEASAVSPPLP